MAIWLASCRYEGTSTNGSRVAIQKATSDQRHRLWAWRYACGSAIAAWATTAFIDMGGPRRPPKPPNARRCLGTAAAPLEAWTAAQPCRSAPPEEAGRPPHEQPDHDQVDQEGAELGHVVL